jgi:hypothetical protein
MGIARERGKGGEGSNPDPILTKGPSMAPESKKPATLARYGLL